MVSVMVWMKEAHSKVLEPTNRNLIRRLGGKGCITNQSPKGKRKTEVVNQEVVERKISVIPSGGPTHISQDMVEKGLGRESDDVIVGKSRRTETIYSTSRY